MTETIGVEFEVQAQDPETKEWKKLPIESGTKIRMRVSYPDEAPGEWSTAFSGKIDTFNIVSRGGEPPTMNIVCKDEYEKAKNLFNIETKDGDMQDFVDDLMGKAGISRSVDVSMSGKIPVTIVDAYLKLNKIVDSIMEKIKSSWKT